MKKYDGNRMVSIIIEEDQHKFIKDHCLNLSALVRGLLRGYIKRHNSNVQSTKPIDGN